MNDRIGIFIAHVVVNGEMTLTALPIAKHKANINSL
jgi:hypothetical protein